MSKQDIKKVVLAYSGGLDTSVILRWCKIIIARPLVIGYSNPL